VFKNNFEKQENENIVELEFETSDLEHWRENLENNQLKKVRLLKLFSFL